MLRHTLHQLLPNVGRVRDRHSNTNFGYCAEPDSAALYSFRVYVYESGLPCGGEEEASTQLYVSDMIMTSILITVADEHQLSSI